MVEQDQSWFEASHALRMFPTFVWKAEPKKDAIRRIKSAILRKLGEIRPAPALAAGESWQSPQDLHRLEELGELVSCIDAVTNTVLEYLRIGHDGFEITACWANANAPGAGHRQHSHPNNFLSGVYYVKTQQGADTVNFHDPRIQVGIIRPPVTELTAENADQVVVNVRNGTLLVFPAWLQHSVDPNRSDRERISVSFNVMFSSYSETISKPLWQGG